MSSDFFLLKKGGNSVENTGWIELNFQKPSFVLHSSSAVQANLMSIHNDHKCSNFLVDSIRTRNGLPCGLAEKKDTDED